MSISDSFKVIFCGIFAAVLVACGGGGGSNGAASTPPPDEEGSSFSLSGRVYVAANTRVDLDPESSGSLSFEHNNDVANAQFLSNPITLGGYVSGRDGFYDAFTPYTKDLADFFSVFLEAGQVINLTVFEADTLESNDLDLTLNLRAASDTGVVIESRTITATGVSEITISASGDYFIDVSAVNDSSAPALYTLSLSDYLVGSSVTSTSNSALSPFSDFVPGEVLVRFKTKAGDPSSSGSVSRARATNNPSIAHLKSKIEIPGHGQLFKIADTAMTQKMLFDSDSTGFADDHHNQQKWQTLEHIKALNERDDVEFASPNYIYRASFVPNDNLYDRQWNLPLINMPGAWAGALIDGGAGAGVTVAVIDSGVDQDHEDLDDNLLLTQNNSQRHGYDFISNADWAGDGDGLDDDPRDLSASFHGQHVAGIIAAEGNNVSGIAGVAFDAKIMPLRALGVDDLGSTADIANAILYAAGLPNSSGELPSNPADIINLSLGSSDFDPFMQAAISDALAQDVIVVAAAGNENTDALFYPAAYTDVIGVSSVDSDRGKSSFSNFGSYVDIAAPGGTGVVFDQNIGYQEQILSTVYANSYLDYQGTSMAAPHVSGVLALMKSLDPGFGVDEALYAIEQKLITDDLGNDQLYGSGLINAAKAVDLANGDGVSIPPTLNVVPSSLKYIGNDDSNKLVVSNSGSGTITASINTLDSWITIVPNDIDADGLGEYVVQVDLDAVPLNETLSGQIQIDYQVDGGSIEQKNISVFVSRSDTGDDTVGDLFVYLLALQDINQAEQSNEDFITVYQVVSAQKVPDSNEYQFAFSDVPEGEYYLEASTNLDADYLFYDEGEGIGAYPLLSQPSIIQLDSNQNNLIFDVSFPYSIQGSQSSIEPEEVKTGASKPRKRFVK